MRQTRGANRGVEAGLVLLSAATLAHEVILTRIFSYSLNPVIAFSAVAVAMLGFGIGATVLSLVRRDPGRDQAPLLCNLCLAFAASVVLVAAWFARASHHVMMAGEWRLDLPWAASVFLPWVAPYALSGMATAAVLESGVANIGRLYAWNMGGAAVGAVLGLTLLRPIGAERILALTAVASACAAMVFGWPAGRARRLVAAVALAASIACVPFAARIFPFQPDTGEIVERLSAIDRRFAGVEPVVELSAWDPVGRIEVSSHGPMRVSVAEPTGFRTVTIDGGAMTVIIEDPGTPGWGRELFEESVYSIPYRLVENPDVLVIGVGGGTEIDAALHWGARRVTGVEISLVTVRALTGPYAAFAGWPRRKDVVRIVHQDGRSFAKSSHERFDVVQMTGVDTLTMHSSGAMALAEDYLYTVEAFADFLGLLGPGGVLAVNRFGKEGSTLAAIAIAALERMGEERPEDHVAVVRQAMLSGVVVKRDPLTEADASVLAGIGTRTAPSGVFIPHYDAVGVSLGAPMELVGRDAVAAIAVPTDDRPYYMLGSWLAAIGGEGSGHAGIPRLILMYSCVTAAAALLLLLLPAVLIRRRTDSGATPMAAVVAYFGALGAGYMLIEMALMHRMVVLVGTPGAAVTVVLASLLVSSGLGALTTDRGTLGGRAKITIALAGIACLGTLHALGGPLLEHAFGWPAWARGAVAAISIAPLGFFMGWLFPEGLRAVSLRWPAAVPWAIAVNGLASVIGSLAVLPLSIVTGFRIVFVVAIGVYAAGALAMIAVVRPAARPAAHPPAS